MKKNDRSWMHAFPRIILIIVCLLSAGNLGVLDALADRQLIVESNVPVTPPQGSHLVLFEMKADPEDENNLIVCGQRRDGQANAFYGVVYTSHDGGRTWKTALEDRSGFWVTEESCAFGQHHLAYFISQATEFQEDYEGAETTRIFVSSDAGSTWRESAKTGTTDYSSSVVGRSFDGKSQQLYVLSNGTSKMNPAKKLGSTLEFFTVSEDGVRVAQAQTVSGIAERDYRGVYPSSSVALRDGTPIVVYVAGKKGASPDGILHFDLGVVRFPPNTSPELTIVATKSAKNIGPGSLCPANLSDTLAYDKNRDELLLAYNNIVSGRCAVMLTSSRDGGKTWLPAHELPPPPEFASVMYMPILTVNKDGVLGVLWRGRPDRSPDCWYFSTSRDGFHLDDTVILSPCAREDYLKEQSSGYLDVGFQQAKPGQPIEVSLLTRRELLMRVGITSTPDGAFHPLWSAFGDGFGELRTARIWTVGEEPQAPAGRAPDAATLTDVTEKIAVLYGGEQRIDHTTNSAMLDVSFRNKSSSPLSGPLYLRVENASSDFGKIELIDPRPFTSAGADYVDISSRLGAESIAPGETTPPLRLTFHFRNEDSAEHSRNYILKFALRILSGRNP